MLSACIFPTKSRATTRCVLPLVLVSLISGTTTTRFAQLVHPWCVPVPWGTVIQKSDPGAGGSGDPELSAGGWAGLSALPARRADSSATRPPLVNARRTQHGLRTLLALGPLPTRPGERRADRRSSGAGRPRQRAEQEEASCGCRREGRRLRGPGRRPSRERRAGGPTGEDGSVRNLLFLLSPSPSQGGG